MDALICFSSSNIKTYSHEFLFFGLNVLCSVNLYLFNAHQRLLHMNWSCNHNGNKAALTPRHVESVTL